MADPNRFDHNKKIMLVIIIITYSHSEMVTWSDIEKSRVFAILKCETGVKA